MSGIRPNAAAELLGVSPDTLRSWERRFGYPQPRRTEGGHRQYELADLEALRRALLETHNISSAIELARQRGEGPTSPARLVEAFDRFQEQAADRAMEESLSVRSVERTIEELLLPALQVASERSARGPEYEFGCRWATGWLHAARRVVPAPTRREGVLIFDSSTALSMEAVQVQALELALRRAGFRVLLLSISLEQDRVVRAVRGSRPTAVVLAGAEATLDVVGRLVYATRRARSESLVFEYRNATPVSGSHAIPPLGDRPSAAVASLRRAFEQRRVEVPAPELAAPLALGTRARAAAR